MLERGRAVVRPLALGNPRTDAWRGGGTVSVLCFGQTSRRRRILSRATACLERAAEGMARTVIKRHAGDDAASWRLLANSVLPRVTPVCRRLSRSRRATARGGRELRGRKVRRRRARAWAESVSRHGPGVGVLLRHAELVRVRRRCHVDRRMRLEEIVRELERDWATQSADAIFRGCDIRCPGKLAVIMSNRPLTTPVRRSTLTRSVWSSLTTPRYSSDMRPSWWATSAGSSTR